MSEKPILFSAPMVRAILEDRKTQTRRVVKPQPPAEERFVARVSGAMAALQAVDNTDLSRILRCPYGEAGDRLWVRETWKAEELEPFGEDGIRYAADGAFRQIDNTRAAADRWGDAYRPDGKWRPSIFMPRWASRITLEITGIRVERVQAIGGRDVFAEGIISLDAAGPIRAFSQLWDEINQARGFGWDVNPWVWVVEFRRVK